MPRDPVTQQEFSGELELPSFFDRLPDLTQILRQLGEELRKSSVKQSYLPFWEDLYVVTHNLKGVLKILSCPEDLAEFISRFDELLLEALTGDKICRKIKDAGLLFLEMATILDQQDSQENSGKELDIFLDKLIHLYEVDIHHDERIKFVPAHLFYVNEFVSKKAREIHLLNLNHCVLEDEILLDEIPLWRTQLNEALLSAEFGRGLIINFLPFLSPEGSRRLKVWAWIAAATHSRAALKQRIKEIMPRVSITKL